MTVNSSVWPIVANSFTNIQACLQRILFKSHPILVARFTFLDLRTRLATCTMLKTSAIPLHTTTASYNKKECYLPTVGMHTFYMFCLPYMVRCFKFHRYCSPVRGHPHLLWQTCKVLCPWALFRMTMVYWSASDSFSHASLWHSIIRKWR